MSALAWALAGALAVAFAPMQTAETVPRGRLMLSLTAGLALQQVGLPSLPVFPVLTGEVELAWGVDDGIDVRLRYGTYLGLVHRIGPELRLRLFGGARFTVAARLHPSVRLSGSPNARTELCAAREAGATAEDGGTSVAGDFTTQTSLLFTLRTRRGDSPRGSDPGGPAAVTVEVGLATQWILYAHRCGRTVVDAAPYPAWVDLALVVERPIRPQVNLTLRIELGVSLTPDDPFAVRGLYPRVLLGGNFGL